MVKYNYKKLHTKQLTEYTHLDIQKLYISYVAVLIKSQELQNKLEKSYVKLHNGKLNWFAKRKLQKMNQLLNDMLLDVVQMQHKITFLSLHKSKCSCFICTCDEPCTCNKQ